MQSLRLYLRSREVPTAIKGPAEVVFDLITATDTTPAAACCLHILSDPLTLCLQVAELQSKIDALYRAAFSEVDVVVPAPQSMSAERSTTSSERFPDLSEATFGLLGRQRPHAMKVRTGKFISCLFAYIYVYQYMELLYGESTILM